MFPTKESMIQKNKEKEQNELLEIFLLIEENTMAAKASALLRYAKLYGIKDKIKANKLMKNDYADFISVRGQK
jgi:hypothetical protein